MIIAESNGKQQDDEGPRTKRSEDQRKRKEKEKRALTTAAQHSIQTTLDSAAPTPTVNYEDKARLASRRITERTICRASSYTTGPPPWLRLHSNGQSRHSCGHAGEESRLPRPKTMPPTLLTAVIVATEVTVHAQSQEAPKGSKSSRRRPKEGNDVGDDATVQPCSRIWVFTPRT